MSDDVLSPIPQWCNRENAGGRRVHVREQVTWTGAVRRCVCPRAPSGGQTATRKRRSEKLDYDDSDFVPFLPLYILPCLFIPAEQQEVYKMSKLEKTQEEVEEVKVIMIDNLNKAEERKEKLEDLDKRAALLLNKSQSFRKKSKLVKKKKRREYLRSKAGLIAIVAVLALVIIVVLAVMFNTGTSSDTSVERAAVPASLNKTEHL